MKRSTLIFVLLTMFLSTAGFTIIIPILPFLVGQYVSASSDAFWFGALVSVYAFCQFLSAPTLGVLSDRFGRRPILIVSLLGSFVGYIITGIGGALWILFLGRIIDGLTGGNISTVYAYIADLAEGKDRGRYYGYLGAAGGAGFIVGPAVGGLVGNWSLTAPLYAAAAITVLNMLWGFFVLPESLPPSKRSKGFQWAHANPLFQFKQLFTMPNVRWMLIFGFLFFFPLTGYQGNISVFLKDLFHYGPLGIGSILFTVGIFDIVSQGYLTHLLLPKLGERKLMEIGLGITALGFLMLASLAFLAPSGAHVPLDLSIYLYASVIILIIGDGLFEPAYSSALSNQVDHTQQGLIQGGNQSMQSFSRALGPLAAAGLYTMTPSAPYFAGAALMLATLACIMLFRGSITNAAHA